MVIIQMQAKCLHLHWNEQPIFRLNLLTGKH